MKVDTESKAAGWCILTRELLGDLDLPIPPGFDDAIKSLIRDADAGNIDEQAFISRFCEVTGIDRDAFTDAWKHRRDNDALEADAIDD